MPWDVRVRVRVRVRHVRVRGRVLGFPGIIDTDGAPSSFEVHFHVSLLDDFSALATGVVHFLEKK